MESLLTALEAYRAAGGEGLIFVNDDGLQLIDKFERHALFFKPLLCAWSLVHP